MAAPTIDHIAQISGQITACIDYIDVARIWLPKRLPLKQLHQLEVNSGSRQSAYHLHSEEPAWWNRRLKQVVHLCQPEPPALQLLAEIDDGLVTYVEVTREFVFTNEDVLWEAKQLFSGYFVQPWHRTRQSTLFENGNYQTDRGNKPGVKFMFYDGPSKKTGEWPCLRIEAKIRGSAALRRMGINYPEDLVNFNYDAFWTKHLILLEVDRERLGRRFINQANRTKQRTPTIQKSGYQVDRSTGNLICRFYGRDDYDNPFSMQRLIDQIGRKGKWLIKLPWQTVKIQSDHKDRLNDPLLYIYIDDHPASPSSNTPSSNTRMDRSR